MSKTMQDMINALLAMDESTRVFLIEQGLENVNSTLSKEEVLQIKEIFQPSKPPSELRFGHPVGEGIRENKDKQEDVEITRLNNEIQLNDKTLNIVREVIASSSYISNFSERYNAIAFKGYSKDIVDACNNFKKSIESCLKKDDIITALVSTREAFIKPYKTKQNTLQIEWMKLKLGSFKPDAIVVTFGAYQYDKAVENSFQSYPLYARELSATKKLLIVNIDNMFNGTQIQPTPSVNIFCLKGDFNFADTLKKFLEETPKNRPIVFHSYHSLGWTCLKTNWVNELYKVPSMALRLTTIHGYFDECDNQILENKAQHKDEDFETTMIEQQGNSAPTGWRKLNKKHDELHLIDLNLNFGKSGMKPKGI